MNGKASGGMDENSPQEGTDNNEFRELTTSIPVKQRDQIMETTNYALSSTLLDTQSTSKPSIYEAQIQTQFSCKTSNGFAEDPEALNLLTVLDDSVTNTFTNSVQKREFNGPNGSVTKMTLKNNHLIVETEERNDISRNARETKMHYSGSAGKDGVFVVEVSRGIDSQTIPESPLIDAQEYMFQNTAEVSKADSEKAAKNQEEVQIHQPPRDLVKIEELEPNKLQQIVEVEEEQANVVENDIMNQLNTGLSQSDLSSSSSVDSNKGYVYGNQILYTIENATGISSSAKIDMLPNSAENDKLKANDDKSKPENGNSLIHSAVIQSSNTANNKDKTDITCNTLTKEKDKGNGVQDEAKEKNIDLQIRADESVCKEETVIDKATLATVAVTEAIDLATKAVEEVVSTQDLQPGVCQLKDINENSASVEQQANGHSSYPEEQPEEQTKLKNIPIVCNGLNGEAIDGENAYDSLISLPEPPSSEEITQLGDCIVADVNQLDSLPPPPPPLFMAESNGIDHGNDKEIVLQQQQKVLENQQAIERHCPLTKIVENGHLNGDVEMSDCLKIIPPPPVSQLIDVTINNGCKDVLSEPLTPPESPPTKHCGNATGSTGIHVSLPAVALNVNGS